LSAVNNKNFAIRALLASIFAAFAATGFLLSLIPRRRSMICFIGHLGHYNGNAKFLFEACQTHLGINYFRAEGVQCLFVNHKGATPTDVPPDFEILNVNTVWDSWRYLSALWRSKILVITTPGYDWKLRHLLAWRANTLLLSNGTPLKSPGSISKHFTAIKTKKYLSFWRDINQVWVSSTMERYMVSSSLQIPIERVIVNGAARQIIFTEEALHEQKPRACKKLEQLLGERVVGKRLALVALTHRDYKADKRHSALDSISSLAGFEANKFQDFLQKNNIELVIRDHVITQSSSVQAFDVDFTYMDSDLLPELNDVISAFDIVITDYSGLYLDLLDQKISIGLLRFPEDDFIVQRGLILPDDFLVAGMAIQSIQELEQLLLEKHSQKTQMLKRRMLHALFFELSAKESVAKNISALQKFIEN